jgi:DNA helicase IV
MSLTPEAQATIKEEEETLDSVLTSLRRQFAQGAHRLNTERARARDLTSQIVNARRDTDKQMLASDEAVSHGLAQQKQEEVKGLDKLIDQPYFARMKVEEENGNSSHTIEYKLGTTANTDCRIIDWRKAPIAKLYYEYQEGEDYCELIQGRERNGVVKLRNKIQISKGELRKISSRHGTFACVDGQWQSLDQPFQARTPGAYGQLPQILSLITAEQFRMITEDAESAVLIQGVAGSGKTTVALHRLAWLLHEENSDLRPEESLVLVLSPVLSNYVSSTLPSLNVEGIPIRTIISWMRQQLIPLSRHDAQMLNALRNPLAKTPPGVRRVKNSIACSRVLEEISLNPSSTARGIEDVISVLSAGPKLIDYDPTLLIDRELIESAIETTRANFANGQLDRADLGIILRAHQRFNNAVLTAGKNTAVKHIVADEIQDLSPNEIEIVLNAVASSSQLTLVGDAEQQIGHAAGTYNWKKIREHKRFDKASAVYSALTVSHRSTFPIMKLADYVTGTPRTTDGRKGRVPIWFKCKTENEGVRQALNWLGRVMERYPGSLVAVVCRGYPEARHVLSLLEPTFGSAVRLGGDESFSFEEGIVVTSIKHVKGLEFPHVMLWNPNDRDYPKARRSRNMLYVAISRAEENVCIVTWDKPSELLPNIRSKLVRGYEMETGDE